MRSRKPPKNARGYRMNTPPPSCSHAGTPQETLPHPTRCPNLVILLSKLRHNLRAIHLGIGVGQALSNTQGKEQRHAFSILVT